MIIENEKSICKLILNIERNYGVYIGNKSLTNLAHFLNGYSFRFFEERQYLFSFRSDFQSYIEAKYQQKKAYAAYAWNDIILNENESNEEAAFDAFYQLFHQFLKETTYGRLI